MEITKAQATELRTLANRLLEILGPEPVPEPEYRCFQCGQPVDFKSDCNNWCARCEELYS